MNTITSQITEVSELKKKYFEAILSELLAWHKENTKSTENDLSKLKILKLLFLCVAKDEKALEIFDNFEAWPLGPVEKDVYDFITSGLLELYTVNDRKTIKKDSHSSIQSDDITEFSKKLVQKLKDINPDLIEFSASDLVDLTHQWECWNLARSFWLKKIPLDLIKNEVWIYA